MRAQVSRLWLALATVGIYSRPVMNDQAQQGVLNVKALLHLSLGSLVLLAAPLGLAVSPVAAQNPGAQGNPPATRPAAPAARSGAIPPGTVVAVLDISYVFENHAGFKQAMDQMKQEVQQYEEKLRADNVALTKERDQLQQFKAGSQEYE